MDPPVVLRQGVIHLDQHWPGALTVVGESAGDELHLGSVDTVGVRLPDHELIRACAERFGPIAATSANRHGKPTITNPDELASAFGGSTSGAPSGRDSSRPAQLILKHRGFCAEFVKT